MYQLANSSTGNLEFFDTVEEAQARLDQLKAEYLERESYRFSVAYEEVDGDNVTWRSANLDTDPQDATYNVFNHRTGLHEKVTGLAAAMARMEELKADLVSDENFGTYVARDQVVETMPIQTTILGGQ